MADTPNESSDAAAEVGDRTKKPPSKAKAGTADTSDKLPRTKSPRTVKVGRSARTTADESAEAALGTAGGKASKKPGKVDAEAVGSKRPPKAKVAGGGRVTPKGGNRPAKTKISRWESAPEASSRYTPPTPRYDEMPSPIWVPILMFTMFALGMIVIFLNYVELLPGATSNWYLLVGLGLILGGIITATQYR